MRKTFWETRDLDLPGHMLDRIKCRGLPFYIGIRCDNHFFDMSIFTDSRKKRLIVQFIRHRPSDRWDHSPEYMVESTIDACAFDRKHVEIIFDDTEKPCVSFSVCTDTTDRMHLIGHTMASITFFDVFMEICESLREIFYIGWMCFQQKKCELCCGFLSDSWKEMDHIYDSFERFGHGKIFDDYCDIKYEIFYFKLFIPIESLSLEYEKFWMIDDLHIRYDRAAHDALYRLSFCDADIEEIFLKREFSIFYLKFSNIVSLGRILIQYPDVVYSEKCYKYGEDDIYLSECKSKILSCSFSLRKEWDMSFFCDQDISIHTTFIGEWL